ncbi:hypothetical protein V492_01037 [Pseudogymnoascus sp. VKM F-4246]|nr:hypothetical protein V492_01037 [Pseudogymnoascus sp. VKM F-4246]
MRSSAIVLAGLSALALAAPVQKRAYVTDTVIDYVTVFVTEGNPPTVCIYLLFSSLFPFQYFVLAHLAHLANSQLDSRIGRQSTILISNDHHANNPH